MPASAINHSADLFRSVSSDVHCDVLVIGAGPAGGVAALRLVEAGFSLVCLEQGDWPDRAHFPSGEPGWELSALKQWSGSPNVRQRVADYPIDLTAAELGVLNFNGVGGGSVLYAAEWPRLLPCDFVVHSQDGVAADWPFGYDELRPYYERVDVQMGVSGLGGNPAYPDGAEPPLPPLPVSLPGMKVARALTRLGWHWWPESNAILSADRGERHRCVQRATCTTGCGEGAKASADLTHWRAVERLGGQLITSARVRRVVLDDTGMAAGAEWVGEDGTEHFVGADLVLLAANGIGTPRLLLNSEIANSSGLVGRGLMMHPYAAVQGLFDEPLQSWQGHSGASLQTLEFYGTDPERDFLRGSRWSLAPSGGPLRAAMGRSKEQWGLGHHRHVAERLGRTASLCLLAEDLPEDHNRVELSDSLTDSSGIPAPKLTYRVSDNTQRILDFNVLRATEVLHEAGAWHVISSRSKANGHFLGTARMGTDPAASVVDSWGFSHDVPNLGIIDGSVFVTAGAVNPTSTICALALRTADRIVATREPRHEAPRRFADTRAKNTKDARNAAVQLTPTLDAPRMATLRRIAAVLIPPSDSAPSAADVDLGLSLKYRPDLVEPLKAAIDRSTTTTWLDAEELLPRLSAAEREALTVIVTGSYYLDPVVLAAIDYPGQVARPVQTGAFPPYVTEGLLDDVHLPAHVRA